MKLVEVMPQCFRSSHEAARNCGRYPGNGAERFVVPDDVAAVFADDPWVWVVRDARDADLEDYEVDETGEKIANA